MIFFYSKVVERVGLSLDTLTFLISLNEYIQEKNEYLYEKNIYTLFSIIITVTKHRNETTWPNNNRDYKKRNFDSSRNIR